MHVYLYLRTVKGQHQVRFYRIYLRFRSIPSSKQSNKGMSDTGCVEQNEKALTCMHVLAWSAIQKLNNC